MKSPTNVSCPSCGQTINVTELLFKQVQTEVTSMMSSQEKLLKKKNSELEQAKAQLEKTIAEGVNSKLTAEKIKFEKRIRAQISEEKSEEILSYQNEIDEKVKKLKDLNKLKSDYAKLQRQKDELKEKIESEAQEKITSLINEERFKLRKGIEEEVQLKMSEKELIITRLKDELKNVQRKAEQVSSELQGEAQEIAIEKYLKENFPLDDIQEVQKGIRGADYLQVINTREKLMCGSILYESKRTKEFQLSWIEKFKNDMRQAKATFGVIITEVYPRGMVRLGQLQGVWICSFEEAKGLCFVLRETAIIYDNAMTAQQNKGDKTQLLFDFLASIEFRNQIEAIVDGFTQMQSGLIHERRAMESIWKVREKQINKVILNTSHMYSSIKSIAGNAIGTIKLLELPGDDRADPENSK